MLVVAASTHRRAAFEAADFLMDYLKSRAPFWKKEHRKDGAEGGWVDAKETDEAGSRALEEVAVFPSSSGPSRGQISRPLQNFTLP